MHFVLEGREKKSADAFEGQTHQHDRQEYRCYGSHHSDCNVVLPNRQELGLEMGERGVGRGQGVRSSARCCACSCMGRPRPTTHFSSSVCACVCVCVHVRATLKVESSPFFSGCESRR
jgi:hypothetical protein